jgi:hypothetical protein
MSANLINNYLRNQEQLKLIFAKNDILMCAIEGLSGSTIDIENYVDTFEQIIQSPILNENIEKELTELLYNLNSNEDFRVPASDKIESICEEIRSLNSKIPENNLILDVCIKNKSFDNQELSIKQINELILEWINFVAYSEKNIFRDMINNIKRIEEKKSLLIEKLENELKPIRGVANILLQIDTVEQDGYSQLNEIANESAYSNNFYAYFTSKKNELIETYSTNLNSDERKELEQFYNEIINELSIN